MAYGKVDVDLIVSSSGKKIPVAEQLTITTEDIVLGNFLTQHYRTGDIIETIGFYGADPAGAGRWRKTGNTGLASQYPSDTVSATLTDSSGNEWELLAYDICFEQLGGVADYNTTTRTGTDNNAALAAFYAATQAKQGHFGGRYYYVAGGDGHAITQPTSIRGVNSRFGTRIYYDGTGTKSIRTYRTHPNDGSDDAISVALDIRSAGVSISDIELWTVFDATDDLDYGSDWDVGIMGSYSFLSLSKVKTRGYWRSKGLLANVTLDNGNCDGWTITDSWFEGFWGGALLGPLPESGNTEIQPGDVRGAGGMSDFVANGSTRFFDMNHHGGARLSDVDGGAFWIEGYLNTPAGGIQGHHFYGTRFGSSSLYSVKVGRSSRNNFSECHIERITGRFKVDGVTGANDTHIDISDEVLGSSLVNTIWYNQAANVFPSDNERLSITDCIEGSSSGQSPYRNVKSFTPTLKTSVGGEIPGYTLQQGYYQENNGIATLSIRLQASDITGANGNVTIDGLPKALLNKTNAHAGFAVMTFNVGHGTGTGSIQALISPNGTSLALYLNRDGSGTTSLQATELLSTSFFHITATLMLD